MRFRHALVFLLAAASLLLTAAVPATGTAPLGGAASSTVPGALTATSSLSTSSTASTSTADARARAAGAIVAMTSGSGRTGSAVVVAPGLVITSTHVVKLDSAGTTRIMTIDGGFAEFEEVARDKRLGLVMLRAEGLQAKPLVWGTGRTLVADDRVEALGIGTMRRDVLEQQGVLQSPAVATGGDLVLTDIRIDPLVEGGLLIAPDGKVVGIVVARGQGQEGGDLGWAVTTEAAREFIKGVQARQQKEQMDAATRTIRRVIAWSILLGFLVLMVFVGRAFRRWYKAMEAREEAAMAAEAAAHDAGHAATEE